MLENWFIVSGTISVTSPSFLLLRSMRWPQNKPRFS